MSGRNGGQFIYPFQLYVREHRRMLGSLVWNANDIIATDGGTPRSVKTISTASYPLDSHHMRMMADPNGGSPRIWNEGGFYLGNAGGTDKISPLPYEIAVPAKSECENLSVSFCVSSTHAAFGTIRMEFTAMQTAQSCAMASCIAMENGDQALQDVDYAALRTRLLASGDAAPPVLPQVH